MLFRAFAEWPLTLITRREVQRWVNDLVASKAEGPRGGGRRSLRTVRTILTLLRAILKRATPPWVFDKPSRQATQPPSNPTLGR